MWTEISLVSPLDGGLSYKWSITNCICYNHQVTIDSANGLMLVWHQTNTWTDISQLWFDFKWKWQFKFTHDTHELFFIKKYVSKTVRPCSALSLLIKTWRIGNCQAWRCRYLISYITSWHICTCFQIKPISTRTVHQHLRTVSCILL